MKQFKIAVVMSVAEVWIDDGFNPKAENRIRQIEESFKAMLPYALDGIEVKVKVESVREIKIIKHENHR